MNRDAVYHYAAGLIWLSIRKPSLQYIYIYILYIVGSSGPEYLGFYVG